MGEAVMCLLEIAFGRTIQQLTLLEQLWNVVVGLRIALFPFPTACSKATHRVPAKATGMW
jgi:hypothetical protein